VSWILDLFIEAAFNFASGAWSTLDPIGEASTFLLPNEDMSE
jgi:hypothetical protein